MSDDYWWCPKCATYVDIHIPFMFEANCPYCRTQLLWREETKTRRLEMKKFDNEKRYRCGACGTATPKEDWEAIILPDLSERTMYVCPHCGSVVDISITNVMPCPPVQEADAPEPKSAPKKK